MNEKRTLAYFADRYRTAFGLIMLLLLIILIGIAIVISIRFGASDLTYKDIWNGLFHYDETNNEHVILHELRIPRAAAGLLVGSALAVSGAIMQGVTRNALASPSILGVTSGAAFMLSIAYAVFHTPNFPTLVLFSFIGAGAGAALVFTLTAVGKGGITPVKLALAGSAITALLSALSTAIGLKFDIAKDLSYWYAGGLSSIQPMHVQVAIPFVIVGLLLAMALSKSISVMSLGEEVAKGLGQRTTLIRVLCTIVVLLLTGAAVSIAGTIGFVGLVVPHIVRAIVGVDYRWIIPISAITGGCLLLFADIVGRIITSPFETPVGAITAIIGVPFFLYLARKDGRGL
ncbi:FecCD family ABC transporter permease [Peribacillus asahii]|uniref:FecCD family ABC transporter permease n=1 Tax=Peribacillus asahii TaxID=228899 RepID=UPI00207924B6|nr:iron ABC transporter permease [Peribacillus asahii]USK70470.1 iron ABC transporter permease [Peribacillus asahii]